MISQDLLANYRYQCEERIRRWERGQGVPEWHLNPRELLDVLDHLRSRERQLDAAVQGLQDVQKELASESRNASNMRRIINRCESQTREALARVAELSEATSG